MHISNRGCPGLPTTAVQNVVQVLLYSAGQIARCIESELTGLAQGIDKMENGAVNSMAWGTVEVQEC